MQFRKAISRTAGSVVVREGVGSYIKYNRQCGSSGAGGAISNTTGRVVVRGVGNAILSTNGSVVSFEKSYIMYSRQRGIAWHSDYNN